MKKDIIFYSWQSDLPNADNRNFIKDCLEKAVKEANRDDKYLEVDRDTSGMAGFPNIQQTILKKIEKANIFVADVSIISEMSLKGKRMPNPNVLFELGYAVKALGWERVICVFNEDYGRIDELPFDIKQHRILSYSLNNKEKKDERYRVANAVKETLNILVKKGMLYSKIKLNEGNLLEGPTNDVFNSAFINGESMLIHMDSIKTVEFHVRSSTHGEWLVMGLYEGKGYNFRNDFLCEISYEKYKVQVTCIDLDRDGNKEILVSIGDGLIDLETNIYRFIPESKNIFELSGRVLGQQKMFLDIDKSMIIAPYGSQGLCKEYKYSDSRLWSPASEVENKLFA